MKAEKRRLERLNRLERIRAVARHEAAMRTSQAESALSKMEALAKRSRELAEDYAARDDAMEAAQLVQLRKFQGELVRLGNDTEKQADHAKAVADRTRQELARAERQREQVADRIAASRQTLSNLRDRAAQSDGNSRPRKSGTLFE